MNDLKTLYETDTAAWSEEQAAALRAAARGSSKQLLDWENLAEEIEDLAKSLRRRLRSQIARIIQHQVELEYLASYRAAQRLAPHSSPCAARYRPDPGG